MELDGLGECWDSLSFEKYVLFYKYILLQVITQSLNIIKDGLYYSKLSFTTHAQHDTVPTTRVFSEFLEKKTRIFKKDWETKLNIHKYISLYLSVNNWTRKVSKREILKKKYAFKIILNVTPVVEMSNVICNPRFSGTRAKAGWKTSAIIILK